MARYLLDTNVLLRIANGADAQHGPATAATLQIIANGDEICLTPQVVIEFWSVATRPAVNNGLDWAPSRVEQQVQTFLNRFQLLEDVSTVFDAWRRLVAAHDVRGKRVHDARLVAVMETHQLTHILTFNVVDFVRYPAITAVNPTSITPVP
jgi:predicted nucleic acid-binding protein